MEKTATSGGADDCMDAGRYDYMEVIGTTPGKEEVVNVWNTFSRVEPGAETE